MVLTTTKIEGGRGKGRDFSLLSQQIAIIRFGVKSRKVQCNAGTG